MPTYAYRCATCGHSFEQVQRMSDDALTDCPECAGQIKRVIYPVGVVFKGSGWYINDSRPKPKAEDGAKGDDQKEKKDDAGKAANGEVKDKAKAKAKDKKPAAAKSAAD